MTSGAVKPDFEIRKLRNHHLSLSVWPEGGRILDVTSLDTGAKLVSWWPHLLGKASSVGGIGERSAPEGAGPFSWTADGDSIAFTRQLGGGLVLEKTIVLPPDSLSFDVTLAVRNESSVRRACVIDQSAAICPGCGGACPGRDSGVSNSYERAFLKRRDEALVEVDYEAFEALHIERDDLEWAAFCDPVSNTLVSVIAPDGHTVVRTRRHWWLDWSREVALKPGASWSGDFHFAVTEALAVPVLITEHFVAGFSGRPVVLFGAEPSSVKVFGLGPRSAGNAVTVAVDGKEFLRAKPLPDAREPLVVHLPGRAPGRDVDVEVTIAGKYGQATIQAGEGRALFDRLEAVATEVERAAVAGEMDLERAATVLAYRRIATLNSGRAAGELEKVLRWALSGAETAAASKHPAVPFYSERETAEIARLAGALDLDAEARRLVRALSASYDLSRPRLRDEGRTVELAKALLESALLLSLRHDDEVLALFKARLGDLTGLWARFGQLLHEPAQHAHILALAVPAYKIASAAGVFSLEERIEAQAMFLDIAAKVRRHAGAKFRLSDWRAVEAAGLAQVGALLPWAADSAQYLAFTREAFYWLLVHGMLIDGGFWEMAPQYHLLTLEALMLAGEALLRAGEDCYVSETCHRRLREMCDYVKAIAVPPGHVPAFDDSNRRICGEVLLSLAKRFQDGELTFHADAAFAAQGRGRGLWEVFVPVATPAATAANRGNEVLQGSGRLILRSGCRALTMVLDYGPQGGPHGHHDKGTFEIFWRNICLVPDAGTWRPEDRLQHAWFRTARAHNTVTLGDRDQQDAQGRLVYYQEGRGLVTAAVEARTYDGVAHRREVTMNDRAVIIDDFVVGAPLGQELVWRLNSFVPFAVEGGKARFSRAAASVVISPVTTGVRMEVAEVPLMGEDAGPGSASVQGWQLRIHKPVACEAERILVRMDFAW